MGKIGVKDIAERMAASEDLFVLRRHLEELEALIKKNEYLRPELLQYAVSCIRQDTGRYFNVISTDTAVKVISGDRAVKRFLWDYLVKPSDRNDTSQTFFGLREFLASMEKIEQTDLPEISKLQSFCDGMDLCTGIFQTLCAGRCEPFYLSVFPYTVMENADKGNLFDSIEVPALLSWKYLGKNLSLFEDAIGCCETSETGYLSAIVEALAALLADKVISGDKEKLPLWFSTFMCTFIPNYRYAGVSEKLSMIETILGNGLNYVCSRDIFEYEWLDAELFDDIEKEAMADIALSVACRHRFAHIPFYKAEIPKAVAAYFALV